MCTCGNKPCCCDDTQIPSCLDIKNCIAALGKGLIYSNGNGLFSLTTVTDGDYSIKFVGGIPTLTPASGGGGSGTVTAVSAGDLNPLFTTLVSTATTTPAIAFTLNEQVANTVFAGPVAGANAAPTFRALVAADITGLVAEPDTQIVYGTGTGISSDWRLTFSAATNIFSLYDGFGNAQIIVDPATASQYGWLNNTTQSVSYIQMNSSGSQWYVSNNDTFPISYAAQINLNANSTSESIEFQVAASPVFNMFLGASYIPNAFSFRFQELTTNGFNYIGFRAPNSITTSFDLILPSTDSTGTQALVSNGAGNLSWSSFSGVVSRPLTEIFVGTGASYTSFPELIYDNSNNIFVVGDTPFTPQVNAGFYVHLDQDVMGFGLNGDIFNASITRLVNTVSAYAVTLGLTGVADHGVFVAGKVPSGSHFSFSTGKIKIDGIDYIFPNADSVGTQALVSNGAGTLSWASFGAGSVTSVSGTANRITSTGGATPVIDIAATYVGQTSITTLGTITTGTWTATAIAVARGGTGQVTATLGFNALSPLTTLGDTIYHDGTNNVRLAGQITTTRKFLRQTGSGAVSAAPVWDTLVAGDIPSLSGTYLTIDGATVGATVSIQEFTNGVKTSTITEITGNGVTVNVTGATALSVLGTKSKILMDDSAQIISLIGDIAGNLGFAVDITGAIYPIVDGLNIGLATTNRIGTIYMASTIDYVTNMNFSVGGVNQFVIGSTGIVTTGAWNATAISDTYISSAATWNAKTTLAAVNAQNLSVFAATTSLQLLGVISDETGSGALVFATSPGFTTAANPISSDGAALGTSSLQWSDLFVASGAVMNFAASDITITHATGTLTMAGGGLLISKSAGSAFSVGTTSFTYRTTNGGANVTAQTIFDVDNSASTAASQAFILNTTDGFVLTAANGTRRIARAALKAINLVNTAGSETGDLGFYTKASGAAIANVLTLTSDGRLYGSALHNNSGAMTGATNQYVASGTYTPTLFNTTNVAASTAYVCQWIRVGNVVTVSGKVDIDATLAASSATELGMSLPIASSLTAEEQLGGAATSDSIASLSARIKADAANDRASIVMKAISLTNDSYNFIFQYLIL